VWQSFGWDSIIYIAALSAVDPSLHEAAQLDGANRVQRVVYVDFPAILPTVIIMLILRLGQMMNIGFEKVYLMQNSMNLETSQIIATYVYEVGLSGSGMSNFSYATAIGMFNSLINLILIISVNQISRKVSDTSLW
jgi:putative aldouronate transport system permease protein